MIVALFGLIVSGAGLAVIFAVVWIVPVVFTVALVVSIRRGR